MGDDQASQFPKTPSINNVMKKGNKMTLDANITGATTVPKLFQSATQWLESLRLGKIGAVELLQLHLNQLDKHHAAINAVVARDIDSAMASARATDNMAVEDRGPLQGLPMTIKDTFEVVGMPATCGFPFLAGHMPHKDANAVARLRAAGAVIYGKTNVPTGAFDWQSYNSIYGTTNNPWNTERSPGGSSGGPAAAIAAGFSALELGSDIGGSIRVPSHFCGIYGHKSSYGIVPANGHIPPMPGQILKVEQGVFGPMARSAFDIELALDVLVGPEERQQTAWNIRIPASRKSKLSEFRVAVWADQSAYAVDETYLAAIEDYVGDLRKLGVMVEAAKPDINWAAAYETYLATLYQLVAAAISEVDAQRYFEIAQSSPANDKNHTVQLARAMSLRHYQYFEVAANRERLFRVWDNFFQSYDLIICPVISTVAYPHDQSNDGPSSPLIGEFRNLIVNGQKHSYFDGLQWPSVATVSDLPATAVPTGRLIDGMPVGVQLIGPYLEDRTPIRFAQLVEKELGGFVPPPALV